MTTKKNQDGERTEDISQAAQETKTNRDYEDPGTPPPNKRSPEHEKRSEEARKDTKDHQNAGHS